MMIYHFLLDHRIGGPHIYVDGLRRGMSQEVEIRVVTTGRGSMTELALINLRHFWSPLYLLEVPLNVLILLYWCLTGKVMRNNALFAVHGAANLAPLIVARALKLPVVWHLHETTSLFRRFVVIGERILKGTRHKVAVVAKKSAEVYQVEDPVFLPAFVDVNFWSQQSVSKLELHTCGWIKNIEECKYLYILAVGNLNPLKGMDILMDAMKGVVEPWHMKVVGSVLKTHQDYADSLQVISDEINQQNQHQQVELLGWQDKAQVRALLASCDLFVLPSRSEACPIALLEAMAMGCRIVASNVGDVALMMKDYPNGVLFQPENIFECYEAISTLSHAKELDAFVGDDWQLTSAVGKVDKIYRQLSDDFQ
jgi:glycosyltransferase involved in cell wall biosynthesis